MKLLSEGKSTWREEQANYDFQTSRAKSSRQVEKESTKYYFEYLIEAGKSDILATIYRYIASHTSNAIDINIDANDLI